MSVEKDCGRESFRGWEHIGRAAERFAQNVADEAGRFAERVEEHVAGLAADVRASWREERPGGTGDGPAEEVRRAFREVRGVLRAVIDGVDDVISDLFGEADAGSWARVVANHDARCAGCGTTIAAGAEAWARRTAGRAEFRCTGCGEPTAA
jgi:hypothetical protein